jgi:hypothetical protein
LTGQLTARREIPSSYAYPDNLFRLLSGTHTLDVREFVTQLCPPDLCPDTSNRQTEGLGPLFADSAIVYLHIVTPSDLAQRILPPLGDRWAGFSRDPGARATDDGGGDPVRSWLRSAIDQRETQHEGRVFDAYLDELRPANGRPPLSYMHLQLPHPPWRYLPTGQTYPAGDTTPGYRNFRWGPDQYLATEVLQRSMLQTVFADRLAGRLLDRLTSRGLMDDALVIVTSDHGATWSANGTRREIGSRHLAGMVAVPLFVKYPGQQEGGVEERNAETIDIVPTIADVLDIEMPWDVDGSSLLGPERRGKQIFDLERLRPVDVTFADVRRRAGELEELFGRGDPPDDLYAFGSHRALIGREVGDLDVDERAAPFELDVGTLQPYERIDVEQPVLPAFVRGDVGGRASAGVRYVVALNGVIAGAGQTFSEDDRTQIAVMLSHRSFRDGRNAIAFYEVLQRDRLRPIGLRR